MDVKSRSKDKLQSRLTGNCRRQNKLNTMMSPQSEPAEAASNLSVSGLQYTVLN